VDVATAIRDKLTSSLKPLRLEVIDDSARHEGHAGSRPGGQSHFRVIIVSPLFEGLSRLARQKLVYATLTQELAGPVHALSITARTPDEVA
jgi:BolA protein